MERYTTKQLKAINEVAQAINALPDVWVTVDLATLTVRDRNGRRRGSLIRSGREYVFYASGS